MIRPALPSDAPAIERFLAQHAETSMFLRSNLAAHGLEGGEHPHATRCYLWPASGPIRAVFGRTKSGFLLCQAPDAPDTVFAAYAEALGARAIAAITGPPEASARLIAALGLPDAAFRLHHVEPLYTLELAGLPDCDARCRTPEAADVPLLRDWFFDYAAEIGIGGTDPAAHVTAAQRAAGCVGDDATRLLIEDGAPVAMCAFNAQVDGIGQIGGVFVPPALRNGGRGRRAVHAMLLEARRKGLRRAVLFANNPAAARAYEGIGFAHIGGYRVAVLKSPASARSAA